MNTFFSILGHMYLETYLCHYSKYHKPTVQAGCYKSNQNGLECYTDERERSTDCTAVNKRGFSSFSRVQCCEELQNGVNSILKYRIHIQFYYKCFMNNINVGLPKGTLQIRILFVRHWNDPILEQTKCKRWEMKIGILFQKRFDHIVS